MTFLTLVAAALAATPNALMPLSHDDIHNGKRTRWFREDRLGLIVHWGLYSIPAGVWKGNQIPWYGEWIKDRGAISDTEYRSLAAQFDPTKFHADDWIRMAKEAGMKYFCLVTKHHDGFALWKTNQNHDWNVVDSTPFRRDIVGELADACRRHRMTYGLYYSSGLDWHYPSSHWPDYKAYYFRQLRELLTQYGKIGYLWFDGEWTPEWNEKEAEDLRQFVRGIDPDLLTNNPKKKSSAAYGDFGLDEENYSPPSTDFESGIWERDRLVQFNTWGYKSWEPWKASKDLLRDMIDAASLSMNYCLNIGPRADGTFPPEAVQILRDFGAWMKPNGAAIYKTEGFVHEVTMNASGRLTRNARSIFVHVFDWPAGDLKVSLPADVASVRGLDHRIKLGTARISRSDGKTHIAIPRPMTLDAVATVVELRLKDRSE